MPDRNKQKIIRAIFAAYMSKDRKAVEDAQTEEDIGSKFTNLPPNLEAV